MLSEVCSRISTISCPSTAPVYGMATNLPSGFVEPEESEHKTSATCETEFCNRDKSNTSGACGPFSRHLCDRLLRHARPNVYGHSGNDAKLTRFDTTLRYKVDRLSTSTQDFAASKATGIY